MEVNEVENKRTRATQRHHLEQLSESASIGYDIEDYGQTPLLPEPPTYSDSTAGEAHTPPKAQTSVNRNTTDTKNGVNDPLESPFLVTVPLDPGSPNRRWQRSKYFSTNRRKVGQLVWRLVTILVSIAFIIYAIKSIYHRNKSGFHSYKIHVGYSTTYNFTKPPEFSLIQKVQGGGNHPLNPYDYVRTEGEIHVRPATEHLDTNLRVDINIHASGLIPRESLKETDSTLVIETLNHIKGLAGFPRKRPCVYIDVTIFVAPGTELQNFGIDTQSLAIIFHPGLDFTVKDSATLFTISRPIKLPSVSSELLTTARIREIIIHSSSGSVTGAYPLYDLLSITTQSGSISISYFPRNSSALNPKPGSLVLGTSSASIRVTCPDIPSSQLIPNRDYKNDLSTASGSITATIIHSSQTSLRAASGRILASIHPHGNLSSPSHLSTDSKSGSTTVTVHNSLSHPLSPMRALSASHHFISGPLELFYPSQWQGRIFGDTVSGSLNIHWDGVTVVKDHKKRSGGREIEAERGEKSKARLTFGGVSGSAVLRGESGGLGGMEL